MSDEKREPDGDTGPEPPRPDFTCWIQPEALGKNKGFAARGYWVFGTRLNPRIVLRIRLNGVMYRIGLKPTSKESWPQRSVVERHLAREAALMAQDYGAPQGIGEPEMAQEQQTPPTGGSYADSEGDE